MKKLSALLLILYLGVYGSQLAFWSDTNAEPLKVLPYQLHMYPKADQEALRHGIPISSSSEFVRLLEDYFS